MSGLFSDIFNTCPWVLGRIPIITMTYMEHVLKHVSKYTMNIVMEEIKEMDPDFYNQLEKKHQHLNDKQSHFEADSGFDRQNMM